MVTHNRSWFIANYSRLNQILWFVFIYQYVVLLSHIWLPETTKIVSMTLLFTLIVELIPNIHWIFRRSFQFIGILYILWFVLQLTWITAPMEQWTDFFTILNLNIEPLFPFLWFALFSWVIYVWIMHRVTSKRMKYILIITSVIVFCIIDSFSFLILWDQVAIMIASGLLMITLHHYKTFSKKHPSSWNYLLQYPSSIIFPMVVLIAIIMLAGLLAPNIRPILTDPYTAWKNMKGEPVQTVGKGMDAVVRLSTGTNSSGYSRDDRVLGSGFQFDYTSVMFVDTTHAAYWRGETRAIYTGRGWESSGDETQIGVNGENSLLQEAWIDTSKLETIEAVQTFTLLDDSQYPVLFGAYQMEQVFLQEEAYPHIQWNPENSVLQWDMQRDYPSSYTVVSQLPVIDENQLRQADANIADTKIMEKYVQLPDTVTDRVYELAKTITAHADNDYDKVKAIEQHLNSNYFYNNQPDYSKIQKDFVDSFLFEIKEGYCDYFSTAMVVMARSLNIPARWVKGYTTGSLPTEGDEYFTYYFDLETEGYTADMPGNYLVNNSNAHSWVEVYFDGYGWIPFEPTPGFTIPYLQSSQPNDLEWSQLASDIMETDAVYSYTQKHMIFFTTISLLFIAIGILFVKRTALQAWLNDKGLVVRSSRDPKRFFLLEFQRFLKYAHRKGFSRYEHETIRETIHRWKQQSRWLSDDLYDLVRLFEQVKYSRMECSQSCLQEALNKINAIKKQMK